jgi:hypothetical protein
MKRLQSKLISNRLVQLFCTALLVVACGEIEQNPQKKYDSANIEPVRIIRFDKDFMQCGETDSKPCAVWLDYVYGPFYRFYMSEVLAFENLPGDSLYTRALGELTRYTAFIELNAKVDSAFANIGVIENELTDAMAIYKAQFPNQELPQFISFVSEFGYANISYENMIGIGLDMYMNQTFRDYYFALNFPDFMVRKLQTEYLVPNAIKTLAISRYEEQTDREKRFFAMMIQEGKYRYFTKALLPQVHDSIILGYTANQLDWCKKNEPEMWAHYVEKEMLYQQEPSKYMRYFNDGPFTVADGVPPESAPAIGTYTGWQIVKAYMNRHPEVSLKALMEETDYDKILKESKYRPK